MSVATGRVFFYVQHLLGVGHLKRAATLVDALTRAGLEVTLVTGGLPVTGLHIRAKRCIQLAPASAADLTFKTLVDACGEPVDDRWRQARREQLLAAWVDADPDVLIVELFPFGRRQMRFELLPLLDAVVDSAQRPVVVSSVRDVLGGGQGDPVRQDQMLATFDQYFDHVMVHGDPTLIPFERTFRHAARLAGRLHYTGYVVDETPVASHAGSAGQDEVLVSVGGGAVGRPLLEAAIRARPLSSLKQRRWRLLAGVNASDADMASLSALVRADPGFELERHRPDLAQMLGRCVLSISQGGYNTVMEILQAGTPSVVVPFAGGSETEQSLRARLMAEKGWIEMVEEHELSPQALAQAIDQALGRRVAAKAPVNLDGARHSAGLVCQWVGERRA